MMLPIIIAFCLSYIVVNALFNPNGVEWLKFGCILLLAVPLTWLGTKILSYLERFLPKQK